MHVIGYDLLEELCRFDLDCFSGRRMETLNEIFNVLKDFMEIN